MGCVKTGAGSGISNMGRREITRFEGLGCGKREVYSVAGGIQDNNLYCT